MEKKAFIISHSHWDREWYLPFEVHRMKLIELIDTCMELFETDPEFKSFHLDGQTIVVEDYLAIRPQNREKLLRYIREGRFHIGPWYVLQDEFLTGSEANVRNLLIGMEQAKEYGGLCKVGYFPDSFGNAGQMPQILKQAGMEAIAFGRGVKTVGFNNEIGEPGTYESVYSEMMWESPDGSALLGILFANWYSNGMEIPEEEEEAKKFWDRKIPDVERYAATGNYLFMNGCDHQPVQKGLSKAIRIARKLYPDIEFIHGNFNDYVKAVKRDLPENLSTVKGELINQDTDGWCTLLNTASSRIYLKQMNRKGESALDRIAEPLSVLASLSGREYPHDLLTYSWKTLLQNHPHDSICGCSIDAVHEDMVNRFKRSLEVAEGISEDAMEYIGERADCSCFADAEEKVHPFLVCNPAGWSRDGIVSICLDVAREWSADPRQTAYDVDDIPLKAYRLVDESGNEIPCTVEDAGFHFGYTLPKDRFRQPYMARTVRVTFEARNIPALSYRLYALEEKAASVTEPSMITGTNTMENEFLSVSVQENGTYTVTDKITGQIYEGLGYFEDTGDVGNEYVYRAPENAHPITSQNAKASVEIAEDTPAKAVMRVTVSMNIPKSGDALLNSEKAHLVYPLHRKGGRSEEMVTITFVSDLTLERHGRGVKVITRMDNRAEDHRVRVMFPTDIQTDTHKVESIFEVKSRNNRHNSCWTNPSGCERQQNLVSITNGKKSLMIANRGLYEYEVIPQEQGNTIAVTILRAVGEMGDWGIFETPDAQVPGPACAEYEIVPHQGDVAESGAQKEAYLYQTDLLAVQLYGHSLEPVQEKAPIRNFLHWSGTGLNLTGIKAKEKGTDMMIRWVNNLEEKTTLRLEKNAVIRNVYRSNIGEETLEELQAEESGYFTIPVKPYEIITVGVRR